ncbi:MAG: sigma 54-interacting transcriptional regulator [Sandaracinaceae bacterium]
MSTPRVVHFHGMVTTSERMLELFELIRRVAPTDASVLLRGETGTGKELVARALHALSRRSEGEFRAINCATLTGELLASELFGHVRGAFTGAVADRQGVFALAEGGTLFLDEVAEISADLQARLLRVLQERTYVPLGGSTPQTADVRILAATHKALRREVAEGRFRADLMYRIRVIPIFLPPLRERYGDVEALAEHFVGELNAGGRRQVEHIASTAMDALLAHAWPGNVRELSNVMSYAYAVGLGDTITVDQLPPELRGEPPPIGPFDEGEPDLRRLERERLLAALRQTRGKKGRAAELLGMSRTTFWRKLREHGL